MRIRLPLVAAVAAFLVLVGSPAFAHVAVDATDTSPGAELTTLTFRVPNEEDTASTTQVEVFFPTDVKFEFVATEAIPGWTATADKTKVTWTGGKVGPGQFQEFKVEVGPLPKADSVVFKAIQTYDNGDVVRWIDATPKSGEEPEHPAPELTLTAATTDSGSSSSDIDLLARVIAIVGLALGMAAVGRDIRAGRRGRTGTTS